MNRKKQMNIKEETLVIIKNIEENLGKKDGTKRLVGLWDSILLVGQGTMPHFHETTEEIYYIISGQGLMTIDGETELVDEGDIVYIPSNKVHTIRQTGNLPLRFITVSIDIHEKLRKPSQNHYI